MPGTLTRVLRERQQQLKDLQRNPYSYFGFFRGYVVAVPSESDPDFHEFQRGKVKVRVPMIHQGKAVTPDSDLPWAEFYSQGGGTRDCGSYEPPYIGSKVLVSFEQGHPDRPLALATWSAQPQKSGEVEVAGETVSTASGLELPLEVTGAEDTKRIFHKTFKGHTVICEERAGYEYLRMIDRAGNTVELRGPVADPSRQRGEGNSIDGGALLPKDMAGEAHILLKDIAGQEIKMKVDPANPEIILTTTGSIRLGGTIAQLTFALATLLYNSLRTVILPLRTHQHPNGNNGNPTGPSINPIPDIPPSGAWDSPNIFGKQI